MNQWPSCLKSLNKSKESPGSLLFRDNPGPAQCAQREHLRRERKAGASGRWKEVLVSSNEVGTFPDRRDAGPSPIFLLMKPSLQLSSDQEESMESFRWPQCLWRRVAFSMTFLGHLSLEMLRYLRGISSVTVLDYDHCYATVDSTAVCLWMNCAEALTVTERVHVNRLTYVMHAGERNVKGKICFCYLPP